MRLKLIEIFCDLFDDSSTSHKINVLAQGWQRVNLLVM